MKIAVLSDIHGNLPALQAVAADIESWRPDMVVVAGDIVNRGPLSLDCLQFVQQKQVSQGWQPLRGNHEDFVIACGFPDAPQDGVEYEMWQFAHWAYQQLNGDVKALEAMSEQFSWSAPDCSEFRAVHASMRGNRDGIYRNVPDEKLAAQIAPAPAVFVTAHTHRPLIREFNGCLVINVGAVGAPFDKDVRASYGQFTWRPDGWQAQIVRVPYDRAQTERDYVTSGFLDGAGPLAQLMLVELRKAHGLIYRWADCYLDAIQSGAITLEESVRELLIAEDVRPFLGAPGWVL